jgi:hypothetical protein
MQTAQRRASCASRYLQRRIVSPNVSCSGTPGVATRLTRPLRRGDSCATQRAGLPATGASTVSSFFQRAVECCRQTWREKKGDMVYQVIVVPLVGLAFGALAKHVFEPGPLRDILITAVFIALIVAAAVVVVKKGGKRTEIEELSADSKKYLAVPRIEQFQQLVLVFRGGAEPHFKNDGSDSSLVFHFWLFSASPVTFTIKSASGHVRFNHSDVAGEAQVVSSPVTVSHGATTKFSIRQWITPAAVAYVSQMSDRSEYSFEDVLVMVADCDSKNEKRLDLPTLSAHCDNWCIKWP